MSQMLAVRGRHVLEHLLSELEAEGFSVFPHPSRHILPAFMEGYRPDAIAIKDDQKIAIEIKSGPPTSAHPASIADKIAQHPEWQLRVYYAPPRSGEEVLTSEPLSSIEQSLAEIDQLKNSGHLRTALIAGWATLEAAARTLMPERLGRPQPSSKLIEVLAGEGALTPSEADNVQNIARLRNAAAHGSLDTVINEADVEAVLVATRRIIDLLRQESLPLS